VQFHIKTILTVTAIVAILMAFRHWTLIALSFLMLFAHFALFVGPVAIVFASIVCGRQRENRIDVSKDKTVALLLRAWLSCFALVALFWFVILCFIHLGAMSW
jgi:hypothetical protein